VFRGGYLFKNFSYGPSPILRDFLPPRRGVVLLRQGFGAEVLPVVKAGEIVKAGSIVGRDDASISSPVHSPVSGVVEGLSETDFFGEKIRSIVIRKEDMPQEISPLPGYSPRWETLTTEDLERLIYLSGVGALGRDGIPTRFKSSSIAPDEVRHLIVYALGTDIYNLSPDLILGGDGLLNLSSGVGILKKIMPSCHFHLVIDRTKRRFVDDLKKLVSGLDKIDVYPVEPRYPLDREEMLVSSILGEEIPYGGSPAALGVIVLDALSVIAVYRAVAWGMPYVERIVGLCGGGFNENIHLKVRIGTPIGEILQSTLSKSKDVRVVAGDVMRGYKVDDPELPVYKTLSKLSALKESSERGFLAFLRPGSRADSYSSSFLSSIFPFKKDVDTNLHGEARPCVFCGWCSEVCPVGIIPHLLYLRIARKMIDESLVRYGIFRCIGCNLCSYVCPSKIQVSKFIKEGEERLRSGLHIGEGRGASSTCCLGDQSNL
jgi:electron transport complex protein RnfC